MTDIIDPRNINDFLDSSCALLICSCEPRPKVQSYSEKMLRYLYFDEIDPNWQSLLENDLFNAIPYSNWPFFGAALKKVMENNGTIYIKHGLIRSDGVTLTLSGWLFLSTRSDNSKQLVFYYPGHDLSHKPTLYECTDPYLMAFRDSCDLIFEIDTLSDNVLCLYARAPYNSDYSLRSCTSSSEFIDLWLNDYVLPQDTVPMRAFFNRVMSLSSDHSLNHFIQAEFRTRRTADDPICLIASAALMQSSDILICFRNAPDYSYKSIYPKTIHAHEELEGRPGKDIYIRTFGHFDIFIKGVPVAFPNPKEKELLALLVDRRGGSLTSKEAISVLWENEPVSENLKTRYRKLTAALKHTLESYNIANLIINERGTKYINKSLVICDYYEMTEGNEYYRHSFNNSYLCDYSWSESTLGSLWNPSSINNERV